MTGEIPMKILRDFQCGKYSSHLLRQMKSWNLRECRSGEFSSHLQRHENSF